MESRRIVVLWISSMVLMGCPVFESPGEDPCSIDPAQCDSGNGGFKKNPDCSPSAPLTVELGQGAGAFAPMTSTSELEVVHGPQGGTHSYFALKVGGVDLEKSPQLLVTLEMVSLQEEMDLEDGFDCYEQFPEVKGAPSYLFSFPALLDEEYEFTGNFYALMAQSGCTTQGCGADKTCHEGMGCTPSVCFNDPDDEGDNEFPLIKCAEDCAGGVCWDSNTPQVTVGCETRECGNDGQGGLCGVCESGQVCTLEGACEEACLNAEGCGSFCTPCPQGTQCQEGLCLLTDPDDIACGWVESTRVVVIGSSTPLQMNEDGHVVETGITLFDVGPGIAQVRVEDMCGNVGVGVVNQ